MPRFKLKELATRVGAQLLGDGEREIDGVTGLDLARETHLSFLLDPRRRDQAKACPAAALLVQLPDPELPQAQLVTPNVRASLARAAALFERGREREPAGVHPAALVAADAELGAGTGIGPWVRVGRGARIGARVSIAERCSIGDGVVVGDDVVLHPGVTVYPGVRIGHRVEIHSGAAIGVDGYSIALGDGIPEKIPSLGTVEIDDDVEIFANVTVAKGAFAATRIGRATKIDCLSHIAHNCQLGRGVIVAAFGGLSGSVEVGDGAVLAGRIGVVDHVKIGAGARIGAGSGIQRDVPAGEEVWGHPAKPAKQELRLQAILRKLPDVWQTLQRVIRREEGGAKQS